MPWERRKLDTRVSPHEGALFFQDGRGTRWQVFELECADGSPCLIFESVDAVRRVRDYPDNWSELSATELTRLSWNT